MTNPLIAAITAGDRLVVRRLLSEGANPNTSDESGENALNLAATMGDTAMAKDLLAAGAERDSRGRQSGLTALELAASNGHRGIVALLLPLADLPAIEPETGRTVLHLVAISFAMRSEARAAEILNLLLNSGANPDSKDSQGHTAADLANAAGFRERAALLASSTRR